MFNGHCMQENNAWLQGLPIPLNYGMKKHHTLGQITFCFPRAGESAVINSGGCGKNAQSALLKQETPVFSPRRAAI